MSTCKTKHLRWAVNCKQWNPDAEELVHCLRSIQPEECKRIARFRFRRDAVLALVGRLLLRKAVCECYSLQWRDVRLGRTDRNKPVILNDEASKFAMELNVSHHGPYAVLAGEQAKLCGVDVMTIETQDNVENFFSLMEPQCSKSEWKEIMSSASPLEHFYRVWTLKESYIKATGVGLHLELGRVVFVQPNLDGYEETGIEKVETNTTLVLDGKKRPDWLFEQSYLDPMHCISVALGPLDGKDGFKRECSHDHILFSRLAPSVLIDSSEILDESVNIDCARLILAKPWSPRET
eukprot:CFRG5530T1